jgi:hypothetical protein
VQGGSFVAALCVVICGCVSAPKSPPGPESFEAGGLPLSATARVGLIVSGDVSPKDPTAQYEIAGLPMGDAAAVVQAFSEGFRTHLPEAKLDVTDEAFRKSCLDGAPRSAGTDSIVLAIPGLVAEGCYAQVERLGLRYLILMGGVRSTTSAFEAEGLGFRTHYSHVMKLRAQAFDTGTGALVCERDRSALGSSFLGVAIVGGGLGGGPIPVFEVLDEAAYWKHTAWRLGYAIAGCFVQPAPETITPVSEVNDIAGAPDVTFSSAVWWSSRTNKVPGRLLVAARKLVFLERRPSGGEAPYAMSYPEIKWVSLDYTDSQELRISIYRHDNTVEHLSILQSGSGAIDTEGTQSAYQLVKERAAAANFSWGGAYTSPPTISN